jgi:ribosomal protein L7/L12
MATITSQWIVSKLITNPTTEFEQGYNSAFITILKKLAPDGEDDELPIAKRNLKSVIGKNSYERLTQSQINEFVEHCPEMKLAWVKLYKEIFNVGLVEAKGFADKLWDLHNV